MNVSVVTMATVWSPLSPLEDARGLGLEEPGAEGAGPISAQGPLQWGVDIYEADVPLPEFQGAALVLPPPPLLAQLTSLALKPLRMLATRQLNIRLQAATGLQLYVWANQAVLVSRAEVPLGGFLHGPEPGTRHSLSVPVGGSQVITW
jgi:hypothetical protein